MKARDYGSEATASEPFANAEDAWFWTCGALLARQEGARHGGTGLKRPCDPDDVVLCVERLLRAGRIGVQHAQVLGRWGRQGMCPTVLYGGGADHAPWSEAMMMLAAALKKKGIVREGEAIGKQSLTGRG